MNQKPLVLDPRFYRPPRIALDPELEAELAAGAELETVTWPTGGVTITVKPARTDPPLDAADFEPQGKRKWTLADGLERLKLIFRNMGV